MIYKKAQGIHWLEFEILTGISELSHAIFLRHGGVSNGPYRSLNISNEVGDIPEHVAENRHRIERLLNVPSLIEAKQVHGNKVVLVSTLSQKVGECDALMTQVAHLPLMIKHADCQTAIIYDPIHKALATVHAGWRGNVQKIYQKTVEAMRLIFSSKPQDLLVGIGPSLGPKHAEFKNYQVEFPEEFCQYQVAPYHFDLWAIAREQFEGCGVLSSHIEIAESCTYEHPEDYFSYRRDSATGRHATLAVLNG